MKRFEEARTIYEQLHDPIVANVQGAIADWKSQQEFLDQLSVTRRSTRSMGRKYWKTSLALDKLGNRPSAVPHARWALEALERENDKLAGTVRWQLELWEPPKHRTADVLEK